MNNLKDRIIALKKSRNALILAHFYQDIEIQEIADIVGDSFELATKAKETDADIIVLCGVRFMAESAKILNPDKKVLLPVLSAGCPMADMITADDVKRLRAAHPDAAVVCYINSSAAVKAESDICCTSSSAERIVRSLPQKRILFIPDQNLGAYVASKIPEKEIILYDGYCPIHHRVRVEDVKKVKSFYPTMPILMHPECRPEILALADMVGSTSQIIDYALHDVGKEFIIGTEMGVVSRLRLLAPDKHFYLLSQGLFCPNMKKTALADVLNALEQDRYQIALTPSEIAGAEISLLKMIAVK